MLINKKMDKPITNLLPREIDSIDLKHYLDYLSNGIEKIVNFGTHLIDWYIENTNNEHGDKHLPTLLFLRNFVELVDSSTILIRKSSIDPCKVILRSILETYFNLEYLLKENSEQRAYCFLGWHSMQKLKFYRKLDKKKQEGKQLASQIKKDKTSQNFEFGNIPFLEEAIKNLESLFNKEEYVPIMQELNRLKQNGEKNPIWYRLFNGPRNIVELANEIKLSGLYELLYRFWSDSSHGVDILDGKIIRNNEDGIDIYQIRFPKDAQIVSNYIASISIMVYKLIIYKKLVHKKNDFETWYLSIKKFYLSLSSENKIRIIKE